MYLKRLSLINFKNIGQEEFPLTPGINCFVGYWTKKCIFVL